MQTNHNHAAWRQRASRWGRFGAVAAGFTLAATAAQAAATLYAVTFDERLISINTSTGAGTLIGTLGSDMNAMGLGAFGGKLYTYDQFAERLVELNPTNASSVQTYNLGLSLVGEGGLDFRSDGTGYLNSTASSNSTVYRFTIGGLATQVGTTGNVAGIDGLAFDSADVLYGLGQNPQNNLYTVDQNTAALSLIGATGAAGSNSVGGLEFVGNTLYAVIDSSLYTLNPATGAATLIGPTGFSNVSGLAALDLSNPVPLPGSLALVGLGLALMASVHRRRA